MGTRWAAAFISLHPWGRVTIIWACEMLQAARTCLHDVIDACRTNGHWRCGTERKERAGAYYKQNGPPSGVPILVPQQRKNGYASFKTAVCIKGRFPKQQASEGLFEGDLYNTQLS
eukprot:scaffold102246_cov15-Tisochrysis_lutea.AAC.1